MLLSDRPGGSVAPVRTSRIARQGMRFRRRTGISRGSCRVGVFEEVDGVFVIFVVHPDFGTKRDAHHGLRQGFVADFEWDVSGLEYAADEGDAGTVGRGVELFHKREGMPSDDDGNSSCRMIIPAWEGSRTERRLGGVHRSLTGRGSVGRSELKALSSQRAPNYFGLGVRAFTTCSPDAGWLNASE